MGEQSAKRYLRLLRELTRRQLPAREVLVHVRVEVQLASLREIQDGERADYLADRGSLKQCFRGDRRTADSRHSESPRPFELAIVNHGDANPRNMEGLHAGSQPIQLWGFTLDEHRR